jgi:hypothetical protein
MGYFFAAMGAFALIAVIIVIAFYVVMSLGFYKILKKVGYPNAWMAWVPLVAYYAIADAAANGEQNVHLIGTISIPAMLYKLWWLVVIVVNFVPAIGSLAALVIQVICLGSIFIKLISRVTNTAETDNQVFGYISGLIPIVGAIRFLTLK